jgi:hypothetical protein
LGGYTIGRGPKLAPNRRADVHYNA